MITAVSLQIRPLPETRVYEGWRFDSFATGASALRTLAQDGPRPTVLRCSDEAETALNLARAAEIGAEGAGGGCLAIVGWEGSAEDVDMRRRGATRVVEALGRGPEPDAGESCGRGTAIAGRISGMHCSTPEHWSRRWRRSPSGPCFRPSTPRCRGRSATRSSHRAPRR